MTGQGLPTRPIPRDALVAATGTYLTALGLTIDAGEVEGLSVRHNRIVVTTAGGTYTREVSEA